MLSNVVKILTNKKVKDPPLDLQFATRISTVIKIQRAQKKIVYISLF